MTKRTNLIIVIIAANCLPWFYYRAIGGSLIWPTYEPLDPGSGSIRWNTSYDFYRLICCLQWAQIQLFATWAAISRRPLGWRLAHLLAVVALLTRMHVPTPFEDQWSQAKEFFLNDGLGISIYTFLFLWLLRLVENCLNATSDQRKAEFTKSLSHSLWSVAGVAVAIRLWPHLITFPESQKWVNEWILSGAKFASFAALSVACVWLAFGNGWIILRASIFVAALLFVSCWKSIETGVVFTTSDFGYRLMFYTITECWALSNLVTIRFSGTSLAPTSPE